MIEYRFTAVAGDFGWFATASVRLARTSKNQCRARLTRGSSCFCLLVGMLVVNGCGSGSANHGTVPVSGQVTYGGKPVSGANVVFEPKLPEQEAAFGLTDAEGRFQLQTFEHNDGALPGDYMIAVSKVEVPVHEINEGDPGYVPPPPPKYVVPQKYSQARTSSLTATISEGATNEIQLDLKD